MYTLYSWQKKVYINILYLYTCTTSHIQSHRTESGFVKVFVSLLYTILKRIFQRGLCQNIYKQSNKRMRMVMTSVYRRSLPSPPAIDFSSPEGKVRIMCRFMDSNAKIYMCWVIEIPLVLKECEVRDKHIL